MAATLKLKDLGPIHDLLINLPDEPGGVVVLKAENGGGKSQTLSVINALITGKGKLVKRDGADKGVAEGFGAKITVGANTRRQGEADVPSLEGRFDLVDLVDPKVEDATAREKARVRALIGLAGVKADPAKFHVLVGGKDYFDGIVDARDLRTDDMVELSSRVKRAIEAAATNAEKQEAEQNRQAEAFELAAAGVDMTRPSDATDLENELVSAVQEESRLKEQRMAYERAADAAAAARLALAASDLSKIDPAFAEAEFKACVEAVDVAKDLVERLAAELAAAKVDLIYKTELRDSRQVALMNAKQAAMSTERWRKQIEESANVPNPTDDDLSNATTAVQLARWSVDEGAKVRIATDKLASAKLHRDKAKELGDRASDLRSAAKSVDWVLSKEIPSGPLRWEDDRLVLDTADCKSEPYDRLSDGERYRVAIPYALQAVGTGGVIVLPQRAWADLGTGSPLRDEIASVARECGVWVITAEVAAGSMRAEVFRSETVLAGTAASEVEF